MPGCKRIISSILLVFSLAGAQHYPLWFLNQNKVSVPSSVGFANRSYFADSSATQAIQNACEKFARYQHLRLAGGQAFWSTEIGTFWMGSQFVEQFDSSRIDLAKHELMPVDTLMTESMVAVLMGQGEMSANAMLNQRLALRSLSPPAWTETPPHDTRYFYGVGLSPYYYYEKSSWKKAEQAAVYNLARNVLLELQSLQKMTTEGQEIRHEELAVDLVDVSIIARWFDVKNKVYYVLARMPNH